MGILERWNQYRERKAIQHRKESDLAELIERMVQESDPAIRKVAGYRQQLQKPVENALGYIEGLIASIPGPVNLSAESWDKDPADPGGDRPTAPGT
jgi:methylthioribose-1-phosphate isomerase